MHLNKKTQNTHVMIGSGEHSIFVRKRKGDRVMIMHGNVIEAGLSLEEEQQRLDDKIDDIIYSKPVAFVKKMKRRIKKRNSRMWVFYAIINIEVVR